MYKLYSAQANLPSLSSFMLGSALWPMERQDLFYPLALKGTPLHTWMVDSVRTHTAFPVLKMWCKMTPRRT